MNRSKKIILFGAASPVDNDRIDGKIEFDNIRKFKDLNDLNDFYQLSFLNGMTVKKFIDKVETIKPNILHLSNHSLLNGRTVFENEKDKTSKEVYADNFGDYFKYKQKKHLELVFLNSCYSVAQGVEVSKSIDNVIAMSEEIPDDLAIEFATYFYSQLFLTRAYERSFAYARNNIKMINEEKYPKPQFYKKGGIKLDDNYIEELGKSETVSEDKIINLRQQVKEILGEANSVKEKRILLQRKSPYSEILDSLWRGRKKLAIRTVQKYQQNEPEDYQIDLAGELMDLMTFIHDAIAMSDKSELQYFELASDEFSPILITDCLKDISNELFCNEMIPFEQRNILKEHFDYLIGELN